VKLFESAEYARAYCDGHNDAAHEVDDKAYTLDDLLERAEVGGGK
jgi:hypothetical protein